MMQLPAYAQTKKGLIENWEMVYWKWICNHFLTKFILQSCSKLCAKCFTYAIRVVLAEEKKQKTFMTLREANYSQKKAI